MSWSFVMFSDMRSEVNVPFVYIWWNSWQSLFKLKFYNKGKFDNDHNDAQRSNLSVFVDINNVFLQMCEIEISSRPVDNVYVKFSKYVYNVVRSM